MVLIGSPSTAGLPFGVMCCDGTMGAGWCNGVIEEPELPFVNAEEGRVVLEPAMESDLLAHEGCTFGTFFRAAAVPQLFDSLDEDIGTPLVCGVCCDIVEVDELEEFEDNEVIDEDELAR
ncbi:hypothetical protein NHQ30_010585 [Ciborinia camelliae]|nr:hypothetical protein NHQ30_010585 [Ciborinia camelliae]